ncbi:helix-turn-helix domain-containing protein [Phreatobacter sp.]|uniref:MerR family transcriptional regulator n=1 Tax=Phreatobacter sp. TaxID=1966341 RepID=UPI0022C82534|nr:helix-turn-helix domain-containing protein [Phreatobacter sp.]MCZ8315176.1 helix-turn-helix domain-containing protein [Phreatobacter sp.]
MRDLTIGALSKRTGVKVPTIRYYEQIGLMPPVPRTDSGRRSYGAADLKRLGFIRHARNLGFEIEEIRQLIALSGEPDRPCADADAIARRHLAEIDDRISRLTALRGEIARMVELGPHGAIGECRVIEVLADHGLCAEPAH